MLTGAAHLHLVRVMRAQVGATIALLDNRGNVFRAALVKIDKNQTTARIEAPLEAAPEPCVHITVAQALIKGDKFEQVVQHGTEAGASAFVPVRAERCNVDLKADRIPDRLSRWQTIAQSAAEQSGRARIPEISAPISFANLLAIAAKNAVPLLLLHTDAKAQSLHDALHSLSHPTHLMLAIGPEGGWSPNEVSGACTTNCGKKDSEGIQSNETGMVEQPVGSIVLAVTLGAHILRTETAALVAISQILYHFENAIKPKIAREGNRLSSVN